MRTPVDRCRWKRSRVAGSGRYRCRRRAAGRYWWRSGAADGGGGGWQVLGIVMFRPRCALVTRRTGPGPYRFVVLVVVLFQSQVVSVVVVHVVVACRLVLCLFHHKIG